MKPIKKYSIRVLIGALIHLFFEITYSKTFAEALEYPSQKIASLLYMITIVVVLWEVLDLAMNYFDNKGYDYSSSTEILKIVGLLTLVTLPLVAVSTILHDIWLLPMLYCKPEDFGIYKGMVQGQVLAWLIMLGRLLRVNSEHIRRIERDKAIMQKELLVSQYENLKAQVNPHFLFNSFSVLQSLIETDQEKAGQFLSKLSRLYRYILEHKNESMVLLSEELRVLKDYQFLLAMRHEDSIKVSVDIADHHMQTYVPSMSLQMLIENAVKHNKFSKLEPLKVNVFVEEDYLVISNKVSRKGEKVSSTKIGLENIRTRYEYQTSTPVVVEESDEQFIVKMPILSTVRLA